MNNILEGVLKEFSKLAMIPRPSKHETKVANYLLNRLEELGISAEIDETGNVIGKVAATAGFEAVPLFVLQAHMDMVCVSDSTKPDYNPLTDSIELIRDKEYLRANGTSLGADDGIGIAIILYLLKNCKEHGALKLIFTVDEEAGMSGACGLNAKYLTDAKYLINIDSENVNELVTGCAGNLRVDFKRAVNRVKPLQQQGYKIKISGLKGGHSGEAIGIKHANAIKVLAQLMNELKCEIASVNGGRAMNVIPSEAEAVIISNANVEETCRKVSEHICENFEESNIIINAEKITLPENVLSAKDTKAILNLIENLHDGIYDSETSANIGVLSTVEDHIKVEYMPRFHSDNGYETMKKFALEAAQKSEFEAVANKPSPAWKSNKNSLATYMKKIAHQQGREMTQHVIHGGLECSYFSEKNPNLEIVSIGTTNLDIHSPKERLLLSSIEPTVQLVAATLKEAEFIND